MESELIFCGRPACPYEGWVMLTGFASFVGTSVLAIRGKSPSAMLVLSLMIVIPALSGAMASALGFKDSYDVVRGSAYHPTATDLAYTLDYCLKSVRFGLGFSLLNIAFVFSVMLFRAIPTLNTIRETPFR